MIQLWFNNLLFLQSNYAIIPNAITKLETQGMTMAEVFDIFVPPVKNAISKTPGQIGEEVRRKFDNVFHKNPDLERLIDIAKVLDGEMTDIEMAPDMMAAMKFAPMTSCDAIDGEAKKECHSKAIYDIFDDELWGKTGLKNRKDAHFGEALCQNFALEPSNRMPKLLVDCRFMHAHKLAHILSAANSVPFPICIANFFADDTLNQIVKSQWHFLYGTPSEQAALGVTFYF
uniref:HTH cro/C1-type domain-containing protein n=1 Tax=Globodera pallida TaxID=36090 RepID=A0A183C197_GLOPA